MVYHRWRLTITVTVISEIDRVRPRVTARRVLLDVLPLTVRAVDGPGRVAIPGEALVLAVYLQGAAHIVLQVFVAQAGARQAARAARIVRLAPVQLADLEQAVIVAAVPVEATFGGSVQARLVVGDAHPRGRIHQRHLQPGGQLARQFAALVNLSPRGAQRQQHRAQGERAHVWPLPVAAACLYKLYSHVALYNRWQMQMRTCVFFYKRNRFYAGFNVPLKLAMQQVEKI